MTDVAATRDQQTQLYGAPLGDLAREVMGALDLTQVRLADVLGLSAPMLSQLMSAKRVKIGNPAVVGRLQALLELARADEVPAGDEREHELVRIRASVPSLSSSTAQRSDRVVLLEGLRVLVGSSDLALAAERLQDLPELATLLREAAGPTRPPRETRGTGPIRG